MNNKQQFDPRAGGRDRLLRFGETQPGKPTQPVSQGKEANTAWHNTARQHNTNQRNTTQHNTSRANTRKGNYLYINQHKLGIGGNKYYFWRHCVGWKQIYNTILLPHISTFIWFVPVNASPVYRAHILHTHWGPLAVFLLTHISSWIGGISTKRVK